MRFLYFCKFCEIKLLFLFLLFKNISIVIYFGIINIFFNSGLNNKLFMFYDKKVIDFIKIYGKICCL